ncbi:cuticle protein 63-like [Pararge aegeria]|uniref:Jg2160 protein n=1 Tax=Pararge aegeria aegeria TaxID=348720 RepID=A0A8S4SC32_9NEOP|nr:cuticle protein 63-like [Pararge aegeria]CAH2254723.1 jg2160 [Pararge aegeria aegeria]
MRFLIVAAAVLACAAAAPSGALLAGAYNGWAGLGHGGLALGHGGLALGHGAVAVAAPLAVGHAVAPTIPPGDIQGAAIDAHVTASDHARASVDAAREWHDQASEVQGQAINAAEDHAWQSVNAAQTAQAQIDGASAGVAPVVARQLAGHGAIAPVAAYAAPLAVGHGVGLAAGHGLGLAAGHGLGLAAGHGLGLAAGHGAWGASAIHGGSHSVATSSLSQTHPAPVVHAPVAYAAHGGYGHGLSHGW